MVNKKEMYRYINLKIILISSDPPCKDDNVRFTTVLLKKLCLIKYELDIPMF